jgi:hypothetical protein
MPHHHRSGVTLLLTQTLPPLLPCPSQHQATAAALPPSYRHKAAITAATTIPLLQCCHRCGCHHCYATAAAIKLPPPRPRQAANVAGTTVTLLQCCHHCCCHCCCTAAAATKLPTPSCRCQAAAAAAAKLPLLPCCRQAAAAVTTAVTYAEIKHYVHRNT